MSMRALLLIGAVLAAGCGASGINHGPVDLGGGGTGGTGGGGGTGGTGGGGGPRGWEGQGSGCYTVFAHSDKILYSIDLMAKTLVTVGPFNAPNNDVITDLAV